MAEASVNQSQVNIDHTIINAPIDGIVTQRSVDVGQTVAASMQAPTLFVIAADLTEMQVNANIDEADVGRIRPGQHVTFRVDAYPTDNFDGTVSQIRRGRSSQNDTTAGPISCAQRAAETETGYDGERQDRSGQEERRVASPERGAAIPPHH
jgi:multidrug resistance efflux pump